MLLTTEQIKSITRGAVKITEESGVLRFYKCTDKQIDAWMKLREDLGFRAKTTTGVRFDFYTNSKTLTCVFFDGAKFELRVNGVLKEQYVRSGDAAVRREFLLTDIRGEARDELRVTLVFPSHSCGAVSSVELDDGSYIRPVSYGKKFLFIGDSITQGWNSKYDSLSYAWRVVNRYDADAVINGIGGAVYDVTTFDTVDFDPDAVFVAYGTNDFYRPYGMDKKLSQVSGYLDLVKGAYGDKKVFVISPIWRGNAEGKSMCGEFDEFRKNIEREAEKRGFIAICGLNMVPAMDDFFADRYLHPNDLGFAEYAANLIDATEKYL